MRCLIITLSLLFSLSAMAENAVVTLDVTTVTPDVVTMGTEVVAEPAIVVGLVTAVATDGAPVVSGGETEMDPLTGLPCGTNMAPPLDDNLAFQAGRVDAQLEAVQDGITKVQEIVKEEVAAQATVTPLTEIKTPEEAQAAVSMMVTAIKSSDWLVVLGFALMLLIYLADKVFNIKAYIPSDVIPWVAAGTGILTTVAIAFATGAPVGFSGILMGASAVGFWELTKLFRLPKETVEPASEAVKAAVAEVLAETVTTPDVAPTVETVTAPTPETVTAPAPEAAPKA